MRNRCLRYVGLAAFWICLMSVTAAFCADQTLVLTSEEISLEDVWVYEYDYRNWDYANFGGDPSLSVRANVSGIAGTRARSYIQFDDTAIGFSPDLPLSPDAVVKAELVLSVVPLSGNAYVEVHRVLGHWVEGDGVYHSGETEPSAPAGVISWHNQPSWDTIVISKAYMEASGSEYSLPFDITELVKAWMRGTYANYGLVLVGENETTASFQHAMRSSEYEEADFRPKLVLTFSTTTSGRITNPQNGHEYELISTAVTWTEAKSTCEGLGGHLATANTAEENQFIYDYLVQPADHYAWLGASNANAGGIWTWVTGEPWLYSNWSSGEPNNYCGNEAYLHMYKNKTDAWNDQADDGSCTGYGLMYPVCEWPYASGSLVPVSGIWQSTDRLLSFYLQKYQAGSCIVVVTTGNGTYTSFMDWNYSDGLSCSDDLDFKGHTMQLNLSLSDTGMMTVSLPGMGTITRSVSLVFASEQAASGASSAPADAETDFSAEAAATIAQNGIWKADDNSFSFYLQHYQAGSSILVATVGDGKYTAFLDPDYNDGLDVSNDLDIGGYAVDLTPVDRSQGTVTISLPGTGPITKTATLIFPAIP